MSQATATGLMELEHQRLNSLTTALSVALAEGFGDIVDQREWQNDDPNFGFGRAGVPLLFTTPSDRDDGKYLPIFQSQMDLQTIRAEARNVTALSGGIMGAIGTLGNYTLGGGLKFTVAKAATCPTGIPDETVNALVAEAQRVVDQFLRENRFQSDMDREIDARAREDGEAFLELCVSPAGQIRASFDEPDMICQPSDARSIETWLQDEDPIRYSQEWIWSWSFGVHCVRKTPDDPQGYHVVYDTTGSDWDYIPASRMLHVKRNVPRNVKRGVSDLYWIANDVQREAKIRRNTAAGAALQAAIAWVREHATGITPTAVSNMVTGNAVTTRPQRTTAGTQLRPGGKLREGTVVDIPENMKYLPGPMGSERNPNFILVAQYVSRAIAQRWSMPEFMFTSDASNANYASTLVAESPFVKARETDQRFYSQHFVELMWKVLRLAHEIGRAFSCCNRFEELMQILEITATGQRVSNRDELQTVQRLQIEVGMGITSLDTAAAELGRDLAKEQEKGATSTVAAGTPLNVQVAATDGAVQPPAVDVAATAMNGAQVASIVDFIAQVAAGTLPAESAIQAIPIAFPTVSVDQARSMIQPAADLRAAMPQATADGTPITGATGELLGQNLQQVRRIDKLRNDYLAAFRAGTADEKQTRLALDGLGIPAAKIDLYLDADPANDPPPDETPDTTGITESVEETPAITPSPKADRDLPGGIPSQSDIVDEASRKLDGLYDQLSEAMAANESQAKLKSILEQIETVTARAALAAQVCGMLTPFKPTLQDGQSAQEAPVEPLAAIATDAKE